MDNWDEFKLADQTAGEREPVSDSDPWSEFKRADDQFAGTAPVPKSGDWFEEFSKSVYQLRDYQDDTPKPPVKKEAQQFFPDTSVGEQKPPLGVFGRSWGMLTPEEQKADLEARFQDYYKQKSWLDEMRSKLASLPEPVSEVDRLEDQFHRERDPISRHDLQLALEVARRKDPEATRNREYRRELQTLIAAREVALPDVSRLEAMREGRLPLAQKTALRSAVENIPRGFGETVLSIPEFVGIVKGYIGSHKVDDDSLYLWSIGAKQYVERQFPGDQTRQSDLTQQLASGLGQIASFYGGGMAAQLAKLGPRATFLFVSAQGATMTGAQSFEEATRNLQAAREAAAKKGDQPTVDEYDRLLQTMLGAGIGTTEAFPIASTLGRIAKPATKIATRVVSAAESATEEALQESLSQVAQNVAAAATTDPERRALEGIVESAEVGGILGGLMGTLLPGRMPKAGKATPPLSPEEKAAALKYANERFAELAGLQKELHDVDKKPDLTPEQREAQRAGVNVKLEEFIDGLKKPEAEEKAAPPAEEAGKPATEPAAEAEGVQPPTEPTAVTEPEKAAQPAPEVKAEVEPTAPTFKELSAALPKDESGNPDVAALPGMLQERFGKGSWNELTTEEKQTFYQEQAPAPEAQVEAPVVKEEVPAAPTAGEAADVHQGFYDILESKAKIDPVAIAEKLGVPEQRVTELLGEAEQAGWLKTTNGKIRRVAANRRPVRPSRTPEVKAAPVERAAGGKTIADQIYDAYHKILGRWNGRVRLSDLRAALPNIPRDQLDAAILQLQRNEDVVIWPLDNRREITPADTEAAIKVAGEPRHIIWIERPRRKAESKPVTAEETATIAPSIIGGQPVAKTPEAESLYDQIKGALLSSAAKLLPAAVSVRLQNELKIAGNRARDLRYLLAGVKAKSANLAQLARAQEMQANGADAERIWRETGWYQGVEDKWRFEIDDSQMNFNAKMRRLLDDRLAKIRANKKAKLIRTTLGELLDFPQFFENYPFARDVAVYIAEPSATEGAGDYSGRTGAITIRLARPYEIVDVLKHEIQHLVQGYEGFVPGGNPNMQKAVNEKYLIDVEEQLAEIDRTGENAELKPGLESIRDALVNTITRLGGQSKMADEMRKAAYLALGGEAEAYGVGYRSKEMTTEERRRESPERTQPLPREKMIRTGEPVSIRYENELAILRAVNQAFDEITAETPFEVADPETRATYSTDVIPRGYVSSFKNHFYFTKFDLIGQALSNGMAPMAEALNARFGQTAKRLVEAYHDLRDRVIRGVEAGTPEYDRAIANIDRLTAEAAELNKAAQVFSRAIEIGGTEISEKPDFVIRALNREGIIKVYKGTPPTQKQIDAWEDRATKIDNILPPLTAPGRLILFLGKSAVRNSENAEWYDAAQAAEAQFPKEVAEWRRLKRDLHYAELGQFVREISGEINASFTLPRSISVMIATEGAKDQRLALRRGATTATTLEALSQTNPQDMLISLSMRAIELEAAVKNKSAVDEAVRALRHEVVEFYHAFGDAIFTPGEWATLKAAVRKNGWVETTGVREAYSLLYQEGMPAAELEDILLKEAIAEQFAEYMAERKKYPANIRGLFERLKDFISRFGNWMKGQGFNTWEDVFQRINRGEFKQRFEQAFPELARPAEAAEDIAAMALPGVPEAPLSSRPPGPTPGLQPAPRSLLDIQHDLRRRLGLTVAEGRLDPALARQVAIAGGTLVGQYNRQTDVIRLRVLQDIDTEAHEVAHALENRYPLAGLQQAHGQELLAVASLTGQNTLSEGFAEFFRLYQTNPRAARVHAPLFYAAFENFFAANDPETLQILNDSADQYQQWRNASSAGRLTAAIKSGVSPTLWAEIRREYNEGGLVAVMGMFGRWLEKVYTARLDDTNPIRKLMMNIAYLAEENNQDIDLSAWRNPQIQAGKIRLMDQAAYIDITRGIHWENATGRGAVNLRDALSVAFGGTAYDQWSDEQRTAFGAYLIARRGRWLWQRYDPDPARDRGRLPRAPRTAQNGDWYYDTMLLRRRILVNGRWEDELTHAPDKHILADHEQTIADLDAANPSFDAAAQLVHQFMRDLALKRYQAGLDSHDEFDYKVNTPDYVPWYRDMSDQIFVGTPLAGKRVPPKYRLRGSYRDFIDPIESIVRQVFDTNHEIAVNKPKLLLAQMAEAVRGAGRYAEVVPATRLRAHEVKVREALTNAARQQGVPPQDINQMLSTIAAMIDVDAVATLFRTEQAGEGGDAILHYMDGGEFKMLQIHDDGYGIARDILGFFEAARGTPATDSFFQMVSSAIRIPQKGITSSLGFMYRNIIRDMAQSAILVTGYFPVVSNIRTIASNVVRSRRGEETWSEILARHSGVMGGLGRTDVQMIKSKRITELRTEGVTLQPWRREFWMRTVNPWHEDFWKWAEATEANARQTVARISFSRALADVRSRYPGMPPEQQAFVALEAAVHKSRDYIDYSRKGDAQSQAFFNKTIMFLNPAMQGPDKMVRAALLAQTDEGKFAVAQAIRKKLLPLVTSRPSRDLTQSEVNALKDALRIWVTIALIAHAHLLLELLGNDDDELEDKSELDRAMNVTFTVNGEPYRIPRGFDILNVASNGVRAVYDSWRKEDPTAWQRFRESAWMGLAPPGSSPLLDLWLAWAHGRNNFFDKDIEPEYMKGKLPEERYTAYTSALARRMSEAINPIVPFVDVSPLIVEYTMGAIGSEWSRDILRAYDVFDPDKPALKWQEYPFIRATRGLRGSRGANDFWELMGHEGEFQQAAGSYKSEAVDHKNWTREDIRKFFDLRLKDDDAKAFAVMTAHYEKEQRRLHPMERARDMISGVMATMRDVAANRIDVPIYAGAKETERAEVSRAVRGYTMEILTEIGRREYLNALIALRRPGYEKREPQPVDEYLKELETVSAPVWEVLKSRITDKDGDPRVYNYDDIRKSWPEVKRQLLSKDKMQEIVEEQGQVKFDDFASEAAVAEAGGIR